MIKIIDDAQMDEVLERVGVVVKRLPESLRDELCEDLVSDVMEEEVAKLTYRFMFMVERLKDTFGYEQKRAEEEIGKQMAKLQEKHIQIYLEREAEKHGSK